MVRAVFLCDSIGAKKTCMENRMYFPSLGQVESEGDWSHDFDNGEGSFPLWCHFPVGIGKLEVPRV